MVKKKKKKAKKAKKKTTKKKKKAKKRRQIVKHKRKPWFPSLRLCFIGLTRDLTSLLCPAKNKVKFF